MMIWFWRFLLGYLSIKIDGENAEQLLNRAAASGISIWNLKYKNGVIFGNISAHNFLKLRKIKRNIKSKITITKKSGLFFNLKQHKARIGLIFGSIFFVSILLFLSNFVWIINVDGNRNINTQEIISSCKKIGIYEGVSKSKISNKYDSQRLQLVQKGISWCSLNIEGCVLTVNVSETVSSNKEKRQNPTNLKATIDGKIKKIDVSSGDVIVKVGDVVSKGELLVSGIISNMSSTVLAHSDGEIIAETKRTFTASGEYKQKLVVETANETNRYTISFFNLVVPLYLGNIKSPHNYEVDIKNWKLFNNKIPIKIAKEKYRFTKNTNVTYDRDTLEKMLYDDIKKQVEDYNFIAATEDEKDIVYTDKGMLLKITYNCEENIAVQDDILLSKEN